MQFDMIAEIGERTMRLGVSQKLPQLRSNFWP